MERARALPVCGCLCVCIFVIRGCNHVCEARDMVSAALCMHGGGVPGNILAAHCSCRPPPIAPSALISYSEGLVISWRNDFSVCS